jgi:thioesterase domain-containing protein
VISEKDIQNLVLQKIPLLKEMGASYRGLSPTRCDVFFPLQGNHNHKNTAFGGAIFVACTACCYSLVFLLQSRAGLKDYDWVLADARIRYRRPVTDGFHASVALREQAWEDFVSLILAGQRTSLSLQAEIWVEPGKILCAFEGQFVLTRKK